MQFLLDPVKKRALSNLFSDSEKQFASPSFGEQIPISVAICDPIPDPITRRIWAPRDITGWTFRVGVGRSFTLPEAGTFTLSFGGEETEPIVYNPTASAIESALNALSTIDSAGGVTVSGESGYFFITFNTPGSQEAISSDPSNLAPLSIGEVGTLIEGDDDPALSEVQTLRLVQNPGAFSSLTEIGGDTEATVDVLQVGGSGENHKVRITLSPYPYGGKWSITVGGVESALVDFDVSEDDLSTALGAVSTVASEDNVTVSKEAPGQYLIGFRGAKANTDMGTITADSSGLLSIKEASGLLSLDTPGIELLLRGSEQVQAYLEIEGIPPGEGSKPQKLYKQAITLVAAIIDPASMSPQPRFSFYTSAEADAKFVQGPASAPVDAEVALFDGVTGRLLKSASKTIAQLLDRANHTGTQLAATISDFSTAVKALLAWGDISGKPSEFPPSSHAESHEEGGSDELLLAMDQVDGLASALDAKLTLKSWEVKTANFTAEIGGRYQVDCSAGAVTVTLPVGMAVGDEIWIEDATLSFGTHSLTIALAASEIGSKINGAASNYTDSVVGDRLSIVAISSAYGVSIK